MNHRSMKLLSLLLLERATAFAWTGISLRKPSTGTNSFSKISSLAATSTGSSINATTATPTTPFSPLNPILQQVQPSKTVEIFSLVKDMEAAGETVTSLCVGEPDFLPPKAVLEAATQAIVDGDTRYTAVTGTLALRKAIAADLQRRKGVTYQPTEIVVGNGAKQCVYQGILATCGEGDKVLVPAPYWPSYPEMVKVVGAEPVVVETTSNNGYLITPEDLRRTLQENPDIKLIILCNPSNPTGGVYHLEQLKAIAEVLKNFPNVLVLADEIYERLVYDGECPAFASLLFDRTLTVNGFSKAYAMTGLRLGYVAAPQPLAKAITTIQSQLTSCAGSISQAAGVAALTQVSDAELDQNIEIMREKRDYVLGELSKMPGVSVAMPPNGAFYVLPDVSSYFDGDDAQLCLELLKSKKLAIVPGSSFGAPGTVRLSYATSMEELGTAMSKLREFLEEQKDSP
ncbi:aspartate aminotransferase [Nitzschia inconspicua]|uniref:Aspartate aminotransferase n=1 Tax=Nitzschia inconspicua TaxID=303405 RepID=A0A9K3LBC0_9STRA|nr:aspartate aminotransferase [Nitzschia inconspicua]